MPTSGKSAFNPFVVPSRGGQRAASVGAEAGRAVNGASPPDRASAQSVPTQRGISSMALESKLAELSMRRATTFSALLHVVGPFVVTALVLLVMLLLSWLMHWNFWDLFKVHAKPQDMEFTLVSDTHATRPDKPVFRGNFNQRAGGKTNPKQPLKAVENQPSAPARKVDATAPKVEPQPKPQPVHQQVTPQPPAPQPPVQKPTPAKATPKPTFVPTVPLTRAPEPTDSATAQNTKQSASQSASAATGTVQGPASSQVASIGESFSGAGLSNSSLGNPQGGPGADGVDVAQDADFGPFMADLERRIKRNWMPPRGAESRRVKLLFYLKRDGQVVKIENQTPSGDEDADRAAMAAVQASAPFMPFPPQVKEDILPVEFTFDYNVLNPNKAKRGLKW